MCDRNYQYTVKNSILAKEQRDFYEKNGYLIIPKLINDQLIEEFRDHFVKICNGEVAKGQMTIMKEQSLKNTKAKGELLCYKIQDIVWDNVFEKYITHPVLLDYVVAFTGPNIDAIHSMLINKPPVTKASEHPIHQDLFFSPYRPADRLVGTWTAMEKTTRRNGCLYVIPGTHKTILQNHDYANRDVSNFGFHGILGMEDLPKVDLLMKKGDCVFFHPLLFHGSYSNFSKGFRKAITCHFASSDGCFIDVEGTKQDRISKELSAIAKFYFGSDMSLKELSRLRSRHVRGRKGSLHLSKL